MAISALGALTLPTVIGVMPAILGGAGISVILSNMGFKLPNLVTPTTPPKTSATKCPFEEAHEQVEDLKGEYPADKIAEAHAFLNKVENLKKAHDAMTLAVFSNNVA